MKLLTIIAAAMLVSTAGFANEPKHTEHANKPAVGEAPHDPAADQAHTQDGAKHETTAKKKKAAAKPHG